VCKITCTNRVGHCFSQPSEVAGLFEHRSAKQRKHHETHAPHSVGERSGMPEGVDSREARQPAYEAFEAMKTAVEAVMVRVPSKSGTCEARCRWATELAM
jgi:hypothetical protein